MKMDHNDARDLIDDIVSEHGGTPYEGYSGRGMFGRQCWGITCDIDSQAAAVREAGNLAGIGRGEVDSLGLGWIIYWPRLSYASEDAA